MLNRVSDEAPTNVIRDGAYAVIPRKDLVVGDLVLIEAGDEIPADGWVREAVSLQVNEALLTGKSLPVNKAVREPGVAHECLPITSFTAARWWSMVTARSGQRGRQFDQDRRDRPRSDRRDRRSHAAQCPA